MLCQNASAWAYGFMARLSLQLPKESSAGTLEVLLPQGSGVPLLTRSVHSVVSCCPLLFWLLLLSLLCVLMMVPTGGWFAGCLSWDRPSRVKRWGRRKSWLRCYSRRLEQTVPLLLMSSFQLGCFLGFCISLFTPGTQVGTWGQRGIRRVEICLEVGAVKTGWPLCDGNLEPVFEKDSEGVVQAQERMHGRGYICYMHGTWWKRWWFSHFIVVWLFVSPWTLAMNMW